MTWLTVLLLRNGVGERKLALKYIQVRQFSAHHLRCDGHYYLPVGTQNLSDATVQKSRYDNVKRGEDIELYVIRMRSNPCQSGGVRMASGAALRVAAPGLYSWQGDSRPAHPYCRGPRPGPLLKTS